MRVLVVVSPFNGYEKGFVISDEDAIEAILAGHNAQSVVQANHPHHSDNE